MINIKQPVKILIAVPSGTHWLAEFGVSLLMSVTHFINAPLFGEKKHICQVANIRGSLLPVSRWNAIKMAKQIKATHLLFIDTDHTFPADIIHTLVQHNKDVVSVNCATKSIPANTTARLKSETDSQGIIVYSDEGKTPNLERVWRVGTGIMLMTKKAFEQLPPDCFSIKYMPERDTYQGEDWTMCEAFEKAGVPIWIDHALSRQVGHIGTLDYGHDMVGVIKQEKIDVA